MKIRLIIALLLLAVPLGAAHIEKEKYYQGKWCAAHQGVTEYVLDDRSRVDCVTDEYAIEFEFAHKAYEAVGQALYYAGMTGKKPGIVLIMEKKSDEKYLRRLNRIAKWNGIKVWTMNEPAP